MSEADRAQEHITINPNNYRSDSMLVPGWYRFQGAAGDRMANNCVPMYRCGIRYPGWLSGAHPTVAEGVVTRRVCYHVSNDCCYQYENIRIKNCGVYFVYELPRPCCSTSRYCGSGNAGKSLRMFLIISFSS